MSETVIATKGEKIAVEVASGNRYILGGDASVSQPLTEQKLTAAGYTLLDKKVASVVAEVLPRY
jgi:hypothetical protein